MINPGLTRAFQSIFTSRELRSYVSRAHPAEFASFYGVGDALKTILGEVNERKKFRQQKWERNAKSREKIGKKDEGIYRNQDETVEIALNLNLDPRKPGQALRGSLSLPHGTGKKFKIIAFIADGDSNTIATAKEIGASQAGGALLIEAISSGKLPLNFDRALATPEMMPLLSNVARILGPRGLMPNAKLGTILPPDKIIEGIRAQSEGMVQYRTDKNGIIHAGVGKASFSEDKLKENIRAFMLAIQSVKPESYGKGKKKTTSKNEKYYLKAYLTSSQGKGSISIDLRSLDPTDTYFMDSPP